MEMGGRMALAGYVVDAVVLEGRGAREVARAHGVSKTWVSVQLARYREGGYEAIGATVSTAPQPVQPDPG